MPMKIHNEKKIIKVNCDYCGEQVNITNSLFSKCKHHYCNINCFKKGRLLGQGVWNKDKHIKLTEEHKVKLKKALEKARKKRIEDGKQKPILQEELEYIKNNYDVLPTKKIAQQIKRSISMIYKMAKSMGLSISKRHLSKIKSGQNNPSWTGGRIINMGYWSIYNPNHPSSDIHGYIFEHRLVMETKIGRYLLPVEKVHHLDFDKLNNDVTNLYLFPNDSEHLRYHCFLKKIVCSLLEEVKGWIRYVK